MLKMLIRPEDILRVHRDGVVLTMTCRDGKTYDMKAADEAQATEGMEYFAKVMGNVVRVDT